MQTVQKQPAREIAFHGAGVAVGGIATTENKKVSAWIEGKVSSALKAHEVEPGLMAGARVERIVEPLTFPQLVAGNASHRADVGGNALLDLQALLQVPVLVADEASAEKIQIQGRRLLEREEPRVDILKETLCRCRCCKGDHRNQTRQRTAKPDRQLVHRSPHNRPYLPLAGGVVVLGPIDGPTHTGHEGGGTVDTGVMFPLLPGPLKAVAPVIPSGPGEVALLVPATVDS